MAGLPLPPPSQNDDFSPPPPPPPSPGDDVFTKDAVIQDVAAWGNDAVEMFGFQGSAANISHEFRNSLAGPPPNFHDLRWCSESVPPLAVRYRYKGILANTTETRVAEKQLLRQIQEVMAPAKHIMLCVTGDIQFKVIDEIDSNGERNESPQVPSSPSWPPRVSEPGSGAKV